MTKKQKNIRQIRQEQGKKQEQLSVKTEVVQQTTSISETDRRNMIAALAYQKAEKRDFMNFDPAEDPKKDWLEAEKEVNLYFAQNKNKLS